MKKNFVVWEYSERCQGELGVVDDHSIVFFSWNSPLKNVLPMTVNIPALLPCGLQPWSCRRMDPGEKFIVMDDMSGCIGNKLDKGVIGWCRVLRGRDDQKKRMVDVGFLEEGMIRKKCSLCISGSECCKYTLPIWGWCPWQRRQAGNECEWPVLVKKEYMSWRSFLWYNIVYKCYVLFIENRYYMKE